MVNEGDANAGGDNNHGHGTDADKEIYISDHSRSMRNAYDHCTKLFRGLEATNEKNSPPCDTSTGTNKRTTRPIHRTNRTLQTLLKHRYGNVCNNIGIEFEEHRNRREEAYRNFWSSPPAPFAATDQPAAQRSIAISSDVATEPNTPVSPIIETMWVQLANNDKNPDGQQTAICPNQVRYFQDRFQDLNIPCLIKGLDRLPHYEYVNQKWRIESSRTGSSGGEKTDQYDLFVQNQQRLHAKNQEENTVAKVNRQWFRDELGENLLVPLRYIPPNDDDAPNYGTLNSALMLDEDGRAVECETREVSMKEWIDSLEQMDQNRQAGGVKPKDGARPRDDNNIQGYFKGGGLNTTIYYLKDWHLQQQFPSKLSKPPCDSDIPSLVSRSNLSCESSLYRCPEFFGHDLLNSFLIRFTKGDYRFCYWGPPRSFTARHSDVLHSFSWSYNVVGTKKWTFYCNEDSNLDGKMNELDSEDTNTCEEKNTKTFSIVQESGQTIFVPATWQHHVVNLEETISINHNWITSSNLDLVWDCLGVEMAAIQKELIGWGSGMDENMEACENMLRGCLGLDVTSFVLMTLVRVLEIYVVLVFEEDSGSLIAEDQERERLFFDLFLLTSVLRDVLATKDDLLQLKNRFSAVLESNDLAQNLQSMVESVIDWEKVLNI